MKTSSSIYTEPKTAVIIDCWPDAPQSGFYRGLRDQLRQGDWQQWLWASYGTGDVDSHFLDLLRDARSRLVLPEMTKTVTDPYDNFSACWVMGRSWQHCVWHRSSWGAHSLLAQGRRVFIDPRTVTVKLANGQELPGTVDLVLAQQPQGSRLTVITDTCIEILAAEDFWDHWRL